MADALVVSNVTIPFYEKGIAATSTVTIVRIDEVGYIIEKNDWSKRLFNRDDSPKKFVQDLETKFIGHF